MSDSIGTHWYGAISLRSVCESVRTLHHEYILLLRDPHYRRALTLSGMSLVVSIVISIYAGRYATYEASNTVADIILSNVHALDLDGLFVYGTLVLIIFAVLTTIMHPRFLPFTLFSLSLFYLIRSGFIVMTHLGPYPLYSTPNFGSFVTRYFFGADLFFSGHTGAPFLLALIHARTRWLRNTYFAWTLFFGVVVLLGHFHYTIDVFAAVFITYSIYHLARTLFPTSFAYISTDPVAHPV